MVLQLHNNTCVTLSLSLTVECLIESICQCPRGIMAILRVLKLSDIQWRLSQKPPLFSKELSSGLKELGVKSRYPKHEKPHYSRRSSEIGISVFIKEVIICESQGGRQDTLSLVGSAGEAWYLLPPPKLSEPT